VRYLKGDVLWEVGEKGGRAEERNRQAGRIRKLTRRMNKSEGSREPCSEDILSFRRQGERPPMDRGWSRDVTVLRILGKGGGKGIGGVDRR